MLKSLDGVTELDVEYVLFRKLPNGRLLAATHPNATSSFTRTEYDRIISCLGFTFDMDPFRSSNVRLTYGQPGKKKKKNKKRER